MRALVALSFSALLLCACKPPAPEAAESAPPDHSDESMMEKDKAEKYVRTLREDVERAVEAEKKAGAKTPDEPAKAGE